MDPSDFTIELGDILQIISPTNPDLHENAYYVSYVDSTKVKLHNINTYLLTQLTIDETGTITDESIREIHLLTRSEDAGFARQNRLLPKTWIDIHFGGEMPYIVTGEITNLEEDMIEIRATNADTFYIDFEYKGIPEDIPIDKIVIRDPPSSAIAAAAVDATPKLDVEPSDATIEYTENGESIINIPEGTVADPIIEDVLHEIYIDANELYGEDLEAVFQMVEIPEQQKKYTLETQTNDLMDELLSTIPNSRRTTQVMAKIHNLVERFKELRNAYSTFDENGNVIGKKLHGDLYKPIVDRIQHLDVRLRWLIPAIKQTRKLYVTGDDEKGPKQSDEMDVPEDAVLLDPSEEIEKEAVLFHNYYKNLVVGSELKYDSLYSKMGPLMTPFVPPTSSESLLTFRQEVHADIDAIVNHLSSSIQSKNADKSDSIKFGEFKHMVQRYNLGTQRTVSTEMKNGVRVSVKQNVTPADKMSVQSVFVMPYPVVKYSHIDLPSTNIMVRSQLSQTRLDFFRLFHQSSKFAFRFIDSLEKELDYTNSEDAEGASFLKSTTEYMFDDNVEGSSGAGPNGDYAKLLDVILPKTRVLIKLMQKYAPHKMSFVDVVSTLEPFLIYPDNITYGQYNEIRYAIRQDILEYKKNIARKSREFKTLVKPSPKTDAIVPNVTRNMISHYGARAYENVGRPEQIFADHYSIPESYSSGETLKRILQKDHGALFYNLLTYTLLSLITPNKLLDSFAEFDIADGSDIVMRKECGTRYLAKKYTSIAELQKDNSEDAFWDKEFDTTAYSVLSKYSEEKEKMLPEKFISFLAENLVQKHDVLRDQSVEMANTLIRGKRKVNDGEYAVVELQRDTIDKDRVSNKYYHYYVRKSGQWVRDNDIDENAFLDTNSLFCNASKNCYYDEKRDTCDTTKDTEIRMRHIMQSSAANAFDRKFAITVEELKSELERNIASLSSLLTHKNVLEEALLYKENNVAYNIGKYAVKRDAVIVSPHLMLRDLILSQDDFTKKQQDIVRFVSMFCRDPLVDNGEDIHWKYCTQTHTKLFPASIYQLASVFVAGEDYSAKQDDLCNQVGQLSDDGDAIVDKYSGYVLKKIDFVNEEIYDDAGFKITTHGLIQSDIAAVAASVLQSKQDKVFENETSQMVYNVFHLLCANMGVDPFDHEEFVMRMSLELIQNKDIVLTQSAYEKRTEKLEKQKGKVSAPYTIYRNQILIACVAAIILVSIQSALVSVRPRKTFPGCVYSFGGYPLDAGIENVSGIKYVACVIGKSKSSIAPWNSVEKLTDAIIAKRIRDFLETYVVPKNEVTEMLVRKREYLILHPDVVVPEVHDISRKWTQFLPPMVPVSITGSLQGTSHDFDSETLQLLQKGNRLQHQHYSVYKSKIIQHTYGIVELINENVKSKDVLMKTMSKIPYLENACCADADMRLSPIHYFIGENKNIELYVKRAAKCAIFASSMQSLAAAPYLFNKENTQFVYPAISDNYYEKEQNIYEALIHYCNFDTELPIPDDLLIICREKPAGYDRHATLEEKIEFLKKSGKKYTHADLSHMMRIVNARNIQHLVPPKTVKPVLALLDFLEAMEQKNSAIIEEPLRERLKEVLLAYNPNVMVHEKDTELTPFLKATALLRKYLRKTNDMMHAKIMEFVDSYGNLSNMRYNKIQDAIVGLFTWAIDDGSSDALYRISEFIKESIQKMAKLYPEILLQKNRVNSFVSDYWGFSGKHMGDIQREIRDYIKEIEKYKSNTILTAFMEHVSGWTNDIYQFSQLIPVQAPIVKNGESFYGLFHKDTLHMLYMYCWYSIIYEYIQMSDDADLVNMDIVYSKNERRTKNREAIEERNEAMSVVATAPAPSVEGEITAIVRAAATTSSTPQETNDVIEYVAEIEDIVMGDKTQLKNVVCDFLITCIDLTQKDKMLVDKQYKDIVRSMKRTKEQEKQSIIRLLEDTENNDPKVEKMLKKHKLERWNLGNQSSLFKYDKDAYDRERVQVTMNGTSLFETIESEAYDAEDLARMEAAEIAETHDTEAYDISGLDEEYYNGVYYAEDVDRDFGYEE